MYNVHQIPLPIPYGEKIVQVYLIEAEVLTLIDAGIKTDECWETFCLELSRLGYQVEDILRVILTHHHPDHCGLLDYFQHEFELLGHEKNNKFISKDEEYIDWYCEFFQKFDQEMGIPAGAVDRRKYANEVQSLSCKRLLTGYLKEGDIISEFKVIETPGHATSHISLYRKEDNILIGGDMLLEYITPNPIIEAPESGELERPKVLLSYLESLNKLSEMNIKMIYPGHGDIFENVQTVIDVQIQLQQKRANKVLKILGEDCLTAYDISKEMYPTLYEKEFSLTLSQTIGQLDYLIEKGKVCYKKMDGIYLFYGLGILN